MDTRMTLSVPKSQLNYSQTSSTTVTTTDMSKPKKRIFSSGTKKNRAVFNMKNFWSADNNKKIVSSKKSSIFDVQYVWRPKTVTTTDFDDQKKELSPTVPITTTTTETSLTYLSSNTTQTSVLSPVKSVTTSPKNIKTNNFSKNNTKALVNTVSTHSMATRRTTPLTSVSVVNEISVPSETEPADNSRPITPSDTTSEFSETPSSPPPESPSQSLPTTSSLTSTVETVVTTTPDVISSESSSTSTSSLVTTTITATITQPIISKPKRKIFSSANKKNRAVFDAKNFWKSETMDFSDDMNSQTSEQTVNKSDNKNKLSDEFDANDANDYMPVLRRVKKAHQCHDLGETEQFDDDIKYHLSGIDNTNSPAMRCLSILGLTQQAMRPEFRMHLRAHDDMPRIISALMDAPSDPNLALCTATLMFVYSQDRLTMDIDPNALSLMLQLLETRSDEYNGVEMRHRNKVSDLCEQMKKKGLAKYLKLSEVTAGTLAMETLLSLTSKRAGDWFKEELRRIKGIDFILDTVLRCSQFEEDEGLMVKIDRCMHVLENVTFNNIENQDYILRYKDGVFTSNSIKLLHCCKHRIILSNDSKVFLSAFFSILRVLTHLSESADGCLVIGSYDGIIDLLLDSVLELPSFIMTDQRFDLMIILLCLCINLVEFCPKMRDLVVSKDSKLKDMIKLLFKRIEEAQRTEQQTDELLESHEKVQMTEAMRDSLLHTMLSQSGNHMEHSIIAACIALMLGCTIQDNFRYTTIVRNNLPKLSFEPLVEVLQKLRDFAFLADIMTKKGKERVDRIIHVFKSS